MKRLFIIVLLLTASLAFGVAPSTAHTEHLDVALVSENSQIAMGQQFWAGLDFHMQPGWHVYWLNPGDSGQAPTVKWQMPAGMIAGEIQWPKPERIQVSTLVDYGYSDHVLFMVPMHAPQQLKSPLNLGADVHWLVCREVCIPGKAQLGLSIPVARQAMTDPDTAPLFEKTRQEIPSDAPATWKPSAQASGPDLVLKVNTGERETSAQFFPLQDLQVENAAGQKLRPTKDGFEIDLKKSEALSTTPTSLQGVVVLASGAAYVVEAPVTAAAAPANQTNRQSIVAVLGLAFVGGLILNLMPCVFPVLSLKVMSIASLRHEQRREARIQGFWYTFGILVSFWIITGVLLGVRAAGHHVGWGFQLQSPVFVEIMAAVIFALGLNMMGVFEIGSSVMGVGDSLTRREGPAGSFFTGVLATVVATPCAAPFMGSAVGYALTQSAPLAFLVFSTLALGLAAPYLLLTLEPSWAKLLPRPGVWMLHLKQALSFPLFGAVIWLVWVFGRQRGMDSAALLCGGLLLIAVAGWIYGSFASLKFLRYASVLALVSLGLYLPMVSGEDATTVEASTSKSPARTALEWQKFSKENLAALRSRGKPVLVDFTAAWCLSCQVNERAVFHSADVQKRIKDSGMTLMKADWTNYDPSITDALSAYGRSSVPFYVVYGAHSEPLIATELLTPQSFNEVLDKLSQRGDQK